MTPWLSLGVAQDDEDNLDTQQILGPMSISLWYIVWYKTAPLEGNLDMARFRPPHTSLASLRVAHTRSEALHVTPDVVVKDEEQRVLYKERTDAPWPQPHPSATFYTSADMNATGANQEYNIIIGRKSINSKVTRKESDLNGTSVSPSSACHSARAVRYRRQKILMAFY